MMCISLTKKELGQILRVSHTTIDRWLNHRYFNDLKALGYVKNQKVLMPKQVEYLIGKLDIDTSELIQKNCK
ncbi:MAG: hypothetical protein PHX80_05550 [Candidatus Nanoarchaeia archaeon]|nr:hypothetical protein [Candidatus Nanoarchaeia archaeon]